MVERGRVRVEPALGLVWSYVVKASESELAVSGSSEVFDCPIVLFIGCYSGGLATI